VGDSEQPQAQDIDRLADQIRDLEEVVRSQKNSIEDLSLRVAALENPGLGKPSQQW
jgi:hypothetical protein